MADYKQGQIHRSESGDYFQLVGGAWKPYEGITPEQAQNAQNRAVRADQQVTEDTLQGPYTSGTKGLLEGMVSGLRQGVGEGTLWNTDNQTKANQQAMNQQMPLATGIGRAAPAVAGSLIAPMSIPYQAAVGAGSAALQGEDPFLGAAIGGGATVIAKVLPGLSGMSSRMIQQSDSSGLLQTPGMATGSRALQALESVAPRYTGVNDVIGANNVTLSKMAAKAVGQSGDAPLTAQAFNDSRKATGIKFDEVAKAVPENPVELVRQTLGQELEGAFGGTQTEAFQIANASLNRHLNAVGDNMVGSDWIHIQSQLGKEARQLWKNGDQFAAEAVDHAHTVVMDNLAKLVPKEVKGVFDTARQQYHAQSVLGRSGILASKGEINVPTLYSALRKVSDTGPLAELKQAAITMKDMGGVVATTGDHVTQRAVSGAIGSVFGGIPGAMFGAAAEPLVARLASTMYRAAMPTGSKIAGQSSMASRMANLGEAMWVSPKAQVPTGEFISPNAGKFGQGGGIGRAVSADRQKALADRAERAAAAARPVGRPANAPRPEDLGVPPALDRMTKPQQQRMLDWIDKNPKTFQGLASKGEAPYRDVYDLPEGARVQPQPDMLPDPRTIATRGTEDMDVFSSGLLSPQPAMEIPLEQLARIKQQAKDVAHLSSWEQAKVAQQTAIADRQLAKLNPRDIESVKFMERQAKIKNK